MSQPLEPRWKSVEESGQVQIRPKEECERLEVGREGGNEWRDMVFKRVKLIPEFAAFIVQVHCDFNFKGSEIWQGR